MQEFGSCDAVTSVSLKNCVHFDCWFLYITDPLFPRGFLFLHKGRRNWIVGEGKNGEI